MPAWAASMIMAIAELGNPNPRYTYGFDFGFTWKGFDFSAMFQGVGKRKLFVDPATLYPYTSSWIVPVDYNLDYWTPGKQGCSFSSDVHRWCTEHTPLFTLGDEWRLSPSQECTGRL